MKKEKAAEKRLKRKLWSIATILILLFFFWTGFLLLESPVSVTQENGHHMQFMKVQDTKIAYFVKGSGTPILMNAAFGMTMSDWDPLFIDSLAKQHQVIIFDARGVGSSTGNLADLSMQTLVEDEIALMDHLKIKKAHIFGWSFGSFVAQNMAILYPERVSTLILTGTNTGGLEDKDNPDAVSEYFTNNLSGSWVKAYVPYLFPRTAIGIKSATAYLHRRELALKTGNLPKDREESMLAKGAQENALAKEQEQHGRDMNLVKITAPTLVAAGEQDELIVPENSRLVAERIPNARYISFPHSGHGILLQEPTKFADEILKFLSQNQMR